MAAPRPSGCPAIVAPDAHAGWGAGHGRPAGSGLQPACSSGATVVVYYSTATSSHADAPRGMEFLYSLNRLNVATPNACRSWSARRKSSKRSVANGGHFTGKYLLGTLKYALAPSHAGGFRWTGQNFGGRPRPGGRWNVATQSGAAQIKIHWAGYAPFPGLGAFPTVTTVTTRRTPRFSDFCTRHIRAVCDGWRIVERGGFRGL